MTSYIPTFLTCRLDSFNPVQLRTNMESLGPGMYLVTYKDVFVTYRWFPGGMVAVRPYRFFYSHSSQPSSSSTRHMRTHGLRSSVLAGVHWHIVSSCSLGSSLFLSNACKIIYREFQTCDKHHRIVYAHSWWFRYSH